MKTTKQVLIEHPNHQRLIKAVIRRIGTGSIADVYNYGIDNGYNGFTYYKDTIKFFRRYKKEILALAKETAESIGEDMLTMIANFKCLTGSMKPLYTVSEIAEVLYHNKDENSDSSIDVENALAWFAAEEVCRMFFIE